MTVLYALAFFALAAYLVCCWKVYRYLRWRIGE